MALIALLVCVSISSVSAGESEGWPDVVFSASDSVISSDNDTGKIQVQYDWSVDTQSDVHVKNVRVFGVNQRFGGYSTYLIDEVDFDGQNSGSFVKELDSGKSYVLTLAYEYDGDLFYTDDVMFYY